MGLRGRSCEIKPVNDKSQTEIIIQPARGWLNIDWKGLIDYRYLLFLLVRRDFIARYKQTILGPAWAILQPLLTTVIFTLVFGHITRIPTEGLPPMLFYLCSLLAWTYFSQCVQSIASSFLGNAHLFSKVYFPRLIVPLSILISNLFAFALQLATFLAFYLYFKFATPVGAQMDFNRVIFWIPFLFIETAALSLGIGLWIAALTVKYRDLQYLVPLGLQLWMYLTPVIYPLSSVPLKWQPVLILNPMTSVLESFRYAFFGSGSLDPFSFFVSFGFVLIFLIIGLALFDKVERTVVDTL